MKNILPLILLTISSQVANAQYYYNDIIGTRETNQEMQTYVANKVATVRAAGADARGVKATDYSEYHEVRENGKALRATSTINLNRSIIYSRFDATGRVSTMIDSSSDLQSITTYKYDNQGRLTQVQNSVKDSANDFNQVETHNYIYESGINPVKMWRTIKNSNSPDIDSMEIKFILDENGNIVEEHTYKRGFETGYLYYYYDDARRLTDLVRYNTKLKKLIPDIMFEYDDQDRMIQKITTLPNKLTGNYLIWRYVYNDKGLKIKEVLFNNDKVQTGRVDYTYTFSQ